MDQHEAAALTMQGAGDFSQRDASTGCGTVAGRKPLVLADRVEIALELLGQ